MQYIKKKEYNSFMFSVTNSDGTDYDFSASTVKFIVKKGEEYEDNTAVLSAAIDNSPTCNLMFDFKANETADIPVGEYIMAIKEFKAGGVNRELWSDKCKVVKGVFDE